MSEMKMGTMAIGSGGVVRVWRCGGGGREETMSAICDYIHTAALSLSRDWKLDYINTFRQDLYTHVQA